MTSETIPLWLRWARELQSIGQTGLFYSPDDHHRKRYLRLIEMAAEIIDNHTGISAESLREIFLAQPGYATPKVDVRGAMFVQDKILLVKERTDERWCMPGGWADIGEAPSRMVEREVWEESGFRVRASKVIGVYDANRDGEPLAAYHAYKIVFRCDFLSGEAQPGEETMAVDFFSLDELPPLSRSRTSRRQLVEAFSHYFEPESVTDFD